MKEIVESSHREGGALAIYADAISIYSYCIYI